jgi:predicted  nucleic acid-binding Zn-ribbon protein
MEFSKEIKKLEQEITEIENKIKEKELSLPAHSVKPEMMLQLEYLEEEHRSKKERLKKLKSQ